jgi:hypothetical protein
VKGEGGVLCVGNQPTKRTRGGAYDDECYWKRYRYSSEEWQLVKKKKRRSIQGTKITWATDTKVKSEDSRSPKELKNKRCVLRAFSRNNPV